MKISAVIGAIAAICVAPAVAFNPAQATSVPASSPTPTPTSSVTPSITPSPTPSSMPFPSRAPTLLTLSTPCASVKDVPLPDLFRMAQDAQNARDAKGAQNAQDAPAATAFPFKRSHPRQVRPIMA